MAEEHLRSLDLASSAHLASAFCPAKAHGEGHLEQAFLTDFAVVWGEENHFEQIPSGA